MLDFSHPGDQVIIIGDGAAETIIGTSVRDFIQGRGGNDSLNGGLGVDRMEGGDGSDTYFANVFNDVVFEINPDLATGGTDTVNFTGTSGTFILSANVERLFLGGSSAINGTGNDLANIITGNGAANILNGGIDALSDTLTGGLGNDTYIINSAIDNIVELVGGGTADRAKVSLSFALAAGDNIEFLETNNAALATLINLTGNEIAQTITGNAGANVLKGAGGKDVLDGLLAGLDTADFSDKTLAVVATLNGAVAVNVTVGGVIEDSLRNIENLTGGTALDSLTGDGLANILNGGADAQADNLRGGLGNDTYIINSATDNIIETVGQGTADRAKASVSFVLGAADNIEFLETTNLFGVGLINLTGNEIAQTITGNAAANTLNGGIDALTDTLIGGLGNDTYVINSLNDNITELAGGGTADRALLATSFALATGDNIEFMQTTNAAAAVAINLIGNEIAQTIIGNAGFNVLLGMLGNDILTGGLGADHFLFNSTLNATTNRDVITDFNVAADTILLEDAIFIFIGTPGQALASNLFKNLTTGGPVDFDDKILYDDTSGAMFYDIDGSGAAAAIQFATLTGSPTVDANDFFVI